MKVPWQCVDVFFQHSILLLLILKLALHKRNSNLDELVICYQNLLVGTKLLLLLKNLKRTLTLTLIIKNSIVVTQKNGKSIFFGLTNKHIW